MIKMKIASASLFLLISLIVYWYYNPVVDDNDFNLEFRVSDEDKDFYTGKNKNIDKRRFTYNNERYFNDTDKYELVIHSLDITQGRERIIIVYEKVNDDSKIANITYRIKPVNIHRLPLNVKMIQSSPFSKLRVKIT